MDCRRRRAIDEIFKGMKRKRLPGMNLVTACEGSMPLIEALAAHFFVMLHDQYPHHCLIKAAQEKHNSRVEKIMGEAKNADETALTGIFGILGELPLKEEEWSYLDGQEIHIFYLLAESAIKQTQRWIAEGVEKPFQIGFDWEKFVERPEWAVKKYDSPEYRKFGQEARDYVSKMRRELEPDHERGLCGKPDIPNNMPREEIEKNPAHCLCCGSEMAIKDCSSMGMQQLGMYILVCPTCPPEKQNKK